MKHFLPFLALAGTLALPAFAQAPIAAPAGWTTQTRAGGATVFTPPDLRAGEKYSVTIYDAAPLGGKTLEAFLRSFAGPVGSKPGQLAAALRTSAGNAQSATVFGTYNSPNGQALNVMFIGVSFDGASIRVVRILFSGPDVLSRYQKTSVELIKATRAESATPQAPPQASSDLADAPPEAARVLSKVGGPIVPGVYAGDQFRDGKLKYQLRVYLYENGECRICDEKDGDYVNRDGDVAGVHSYVYDAATGKLNLDPAFALFNSPYEEKNEFCYLGRDASGKPAIYAKNQDSFNATVTALTWVAPPTKRPSPQQLERETRQATEKVAQQAAIKQAKYDAIKVVVAPGRGVPGAQVVAIVHHHNAVQTTTVVPGYTQIIPDWSGGPATVRYYPGSLGVGYNITDDTYLLLRDGTIHKGLPIAPDQFDIAASRRKDPDKWGKWKRVGGQIQMSFDGAEYSDLPGEKVLPGAPNTRLNGRYTSTAQGIKNPITFTSAGRFKREPFDPKDDPRAPFLLSKATKTVPGGDFAGTYSISGYAMTLRYDSGAVERTPFFFNDNSHGSLWFESYQMLADKAKSK